MINWDKPIEFVDDNLNYDMFVEVDSWEDELDGCFVEINMYYDAISPNTESTALFWDQYCVDYLTGKPLNPFIGEELAVKNKENE